MAPVRRTGTAAVGPWATLRSEGAPATPSARGSYPQPRPAGNDSLRVDAIDDDELLASGGTCDEAHGASPDTQLLGEEPQQRLVGGARDRGRGDSSAKDAVADAVDSIGPGSRGQSDGETDVGPGQDSARPASGARGGMQLHGPSLPAGLAASATLGLSRAQAQARPCSWRSPNSARPTRTIVAPTSTAIG